MGFRISLGPHISVIIPTLEEEKTLPKMLAQFTSAFKRDHRIELIVSDGGSKDSTVRIASELGAKVVLKSEGEKENISIGRNRGAREAVGEILIFLNADVIFEDIGRFFRSVESEFRDGKTIGAACNVNIYPEEQKLRDWIFHNFFNAYFWLLNLIGVGMGRGECHIVRRADFERMGGYDPRLAAGEDFDLFMRLKRFGRVKYLLSLTIFESPRRFRRYGYLWISLLWFLNAISVLLLKRSVADHWKPIR